MGKNVAPWQLKYLALHNWIVMSIARTKFPVKPNPLFECSSADPDTKTIHNTISITVSINEGVPKITQSQ